MQQSNNGHNKDKYVERNYSELWVSRIRDNIQKGIAQQGSPYKFEIFLDGDPIVDKTDNIEMYDRFPEFLDETASRVKIRIYKGDSFRKDTYVLKIKNSQQFENPVPALSGFDLKQNMADKLHAHKLELEKQYLQKERDDFHRKYRKAKKKVKELRQTLEMQADKGGLAGLDGDTIRSIIDGIPGIIGIMKEWKDLNQSGKGDRHSTQEITDATFEEVPKLSKEEHEAMQFFKDLTQKFEKDEFPHVVRIINFLAADKSDISEVLNLLVNKNKGADNGNV